MFKLSLFLSLFFYSLTLCATGAIVYDPLNFVQSKLTAVQGGLSNINEKINNQAQIVQIKVTLNTLYQLRQQYQQIVFTAESLSGKYGYGQYLTGPARLLDPSYHPATTEEMLQQFREGGKDGVYGDEVNKWRDKYDAAPSETYWCVGNDCPLAESAKDRSSSAMSLGTTSEVVYNNIRARAKTVENLSKQINETDKIKQSLDLNNSLLAELALMMSDISRLQALQGKATAANLQHDINKERSERKFQN